MSINGKAYIVGAFEHPTRKAPDKSVAQIHAEVAMGALEDAGLRKEDIDGYYCAGGGDAPGLGPMSMLDYLNLKVRHLDATDTGGSSYLVHVAHAAEAIAAGRCNIALVTLGGRPRSEGQATGTTPRPVNANQPEAAWESPFTPATGSLYALCAMRHMYEFGTTSEQLAWIKVASSHHAQHNPNAMLRDVVTVEDVLNSPMITDPLHRLDCCVVSDGGGAVIVARPDIARCLKRPLVKIRGGGESEKGQLGGNIDLTYSAAAWSGAAAFEEAGVKPSDIKYASLYDS
ncbi:MAG TPA: thiolase domain-containing protein, partial [Candidatus Saccharimonadales bacterium]|nr:thiolase domain-containing protein [Candidatus Saccharimonadales bacterium]